MDDPVPARPAPSGRGPAGDTRLGTLEALFDDPSPTVWREVRRELGARGKRAGPFLRQLTRRGSPRARTRARRLLLDAERERVVRRLCGYVQRRRIELDRGLLMLARFGSPDLDGRPYLAALDAMGAELLRRTDRMPPTVERGLCLARYLGDELGFTGEEGDYHHPDNAFLHRTIERKRGLPLTLAAVYQAVARRAGIEAWLVGLPGHVVLRLVGSDRHALVDPFRGGIELTERDCLAYLAERGLAFQARWFRNAGDLDMLERQLRNLVVSYRRRGLQREIQLLGRVLLAVRGHHSRLVEIAR